MRHPSSRTRADSANCRQPPGPRVCPRARLAWRAWRWMATSMPRAASMSGRCAAVPVTRELAATGWWRGRNRDGGAWIRARAKTGHPGY
eukprot:6791288-Prymnesium_polylepis.1